MRGRSHDRRPALALQAALDLMPERVAERAALADWWLGIDPVFAGLHSYSDANGGRSYRDTAHVCYPFHIDGPAARRRVTVVATTLSLEGAVHELGHVIHWTLDLEHRAAPVSWYAETSDFEAFAEAFTAWLMPGYASTPVDAATTALLERLAA